MTSKKSGLLSALVLAGLVSGCVSASPQQAAAQATATVAVTSVPQETGGATATPKAAKSEKSKAQAKKDKKKAQAKKKAAKKKAAKKKAAKAKAKKEAEKKAKGKKKVVTGTALAALNALPVKGRAPKTGYDRNQFGSAWADVDRNGCDTRNDMLKRDLSKIKYKSGTRNCVVQTGVLVDPFSGKTIYFTRGQGTSNAVQIDHVVALSNSWQTGAQKVSAENRKQFANDPLNLLAVDGRLNGQKSDGDAATWLPPLKSVRCEYVARQVAVKKKYSLWVTSPEKDAIKRVLSACPKQKLPSAGSIKVKPNGEVQKTDPKTTKQKDSPKTSSKTDPKFNTCKEAKSSGYGPYVKGTHSEYDWYRDGDKDGTVCE